MARILAGRFATFDRARTLAVAKAVAETGAGRAAHYGDWAVRETGFGIAEHKAIKNEMTTTGFYAHYKDRDFVGKRVRARTRSSRWRGPPASSSRWCPPPTRSRR